MDKVVHRLKHEGHPLRKQQTAIGWCVGFMFLFPGQLFGLTNDLTNDPSKVVEKYLSLDKRGARLNALSYEVLKPYTAWGEEPVWGQVVVISKYTVVGDVDRWEIVSPVEAVIPVTYQIVGVIQWEAATFLTEVREETIPIRIKAVDNRWKIVSPQFPPHVGRKRLIDFVRDAQVNEGRERRVERLQFLREALEQAG
ncbi:MAG: hypothetical protein VST68_07255 [Nitrospirota bacterium]|nr:hypothetical protein [Nitrospirota bacterium]